MLVLKILKGIFLVCINYDLSEAWKKYYIQKYKLFTLQLIRMLNHIIPIISTCVPHRHSYALTKMREQRMA